MTQRTTKVMLEKLVTQINDIAGTPHEMYTRTPEGRNVANKGCYYLAGAYGGWKLEQICSDGGGARDITQGYDTKGVLEGKLRAFTEGLQAAVRSA